jgi:hypothetical protein
MSAIASTAKPIAQPARLNRIRLELARTAEFPTGSTWHGYEFIAPLSGDGHVDGQVWARMKELCHVTRFWGDDTEERGQLVHTARGWCFKYSGAENGGVESFFKLDRHRFTPGGCVTITERDGRQYPFRIVAITPAMLAD